MHKHCSALASSPNKANLATPPYVITTRIRCYLSREKTRNHAYDILHRTVSGTALRFILTYVQQIVVQLLNQMT